MCDCCPRWVIEAVSPNGRVRLSCGFVIIEILWITGRITVNISTWTQFTVGKDVYRRMFVHLCRSTMRAIFFDSYSHSVVDIPYIFGQTNRPELMIEPIERVLTVREAYNFLVYAEQYDTTRLESREPLIEAVKNFEQDNFILCLGNFMREYRQHILDSASQFPRVTHQLEEIIAGGLKRNLIILTHPLSYTSTGYSFQSEIDRIVKDAGPWRWQN